VRVGHNAAPARIVDLDQHVVVLAPRDHFAWLRDAQSRTSVFIPVLLGAGVLLSAAAWLVERIARASGSGTVDLSHSEILSPLLVPNTPLVGPAGVAPDDQRAALLAPLVTPEIATPL
jgi:hypothetical protein